MREIWSSPSASNLRKTRSITAGAIPIDHHHHGTRRRSGTARRRTCGRPGARGMPLLSSAPAAAGAPTSRRAEVLEEAGTGTLERCWPPWSVPRRANCVWRRPSCSACFARGLEEKGYFLTS
jgi:hypothetical protein